MKTYQSDEVFIPGGNPTLTYISRAELGLENKLVRYQKISNKFISITGATKCGKTVLVNKHFPRDKALWFDGGAYNIEESFWADICVQLEAYTSKSVSSSSTFNIGGEIGAENQAGFFSWLVKFFLKIKSFFSKTKSISQSISLPLKNVALLNLRKNKIPLVIDDFHYIKLEDQKSILRALKPLVFSGLPIILISIPHRKFDVLKAERELSGRSEIIEVPSWGKDELLQIATIGFPLLNIEIKDKELSNLVKEALGSPHLMQELCSEICYANEIPQTLSRKTIIEISNIENIFQQVAEKTSRPVFEKLKNGPRSRTHRISRLLKSGVDTDIYGVILAALSNLKPGIITLNYETIRDSLREVIDLVPQAQETSRVLEQMSKISFDANSSTPVLEWEKEEGLLHITDPFFSFFLKWGKMIF
ncbi:MAG: hypothetical protein HPY53_15275 [Brevinematales bacterium]|nr:hypothetical protein [Brevinematales bacterium]